MRLVTERCSTGNPVVTLANGIRTQCVRETEPGDDWEALRSWLYLTFSLYLASTVDSNDCEAPPQAVWQIFDYILQTNDDVL